MSEFQKLSIFWDESAAYVLVYTAYALLVCAILLFVEIKLPKGADVTPGRLLLHNALLAIVAVALFTVSMLIAGWYSQLLGGEIAAFVVTIATTAMTIYFFKASAIGRLALGYDSAVLPALVTSAVLVAPYTLATIFLLLLASGMRN